MHPKKLVLAIIFEVYVTGFALYILTRVLLPTNIFTSQASSAESLPTRVVPADEFDDKLDHLTAQDLHRPFVSGD